MRTDVIPAMSIDGMSGGFRRPEPGKPCLASSATCWDIPIEAGGMLFIDDISLNVSGAMQLGMQGFLLQRGDAGGGWRSIFSNNNNKIAHPWEVGAFFWRQVWRGSFPNARMVAFTSGFILLVFEPEVCMLAVPGKGFQCIGFIRNGA